MLFTGDYACDADEGSFDIGPITDGGWYWINDEDNSAIGNLVAKDTLDNAATELTGAGDGVTMMAGNGAVFVKETATGRVGILPNILPNPPAGRPLRSAASYRTARQESRFSRPAVARWATVERSPWQRPVCRAIRAHRPCGRLMASVYHQHDRAVSGSVTVDLWTTGGNVSTDFTTAAPIGTGYVGLGRRSWPLEWAVTPSIVTHQTGVSATVGGFGASLRSGALGSGNECPYGYRRRLGDQRDRRDDHVRGRHDQCLLQLPRAATTRSSRSPLVIGPANVLPLVTPEPSRGAVPRCSQASPSSARRRRGEHGHGPGAGQPVPDRQRKGTADLPA